MEKPKNCYECTYFLPEVARDPKANGECSKFGWFVNARNDACKFSSLKPEVLKKEQ